MHLLFTKIWISLATVLIAIVTLGLIIALHLAKFVYRIINALFGHKRHGQQV
jgi:hypothetical protein